MFGRFNPQAKKTLERATDKARALGHSYVEPEHLLASLAEDGEASFNGVLGNFNVHRGALAGVQLPRRQSAGFDNEVFFSPDAREVLEYTVEEADRLGHERVGTTHFLLGLLRRSRERGDDGTRLLAELGVSLEDLRLRVGEVHATSPEALGELVPAVLFFELERQFKERTGQLHTEIEAVRAENESLHSKIEILARRLNRIESQL